MNSSYPFPYMGSNKIQLENHETGEFHRRGVIKAEYNGGWGVDFQYVGWCSKQLLPPYTFNPS